MLVFLFIVAFVGHITTVVQPDVHNLPNAIAGFGFWFQAVRKCKLGSLRERFVEALQAREVFSRV